MYGYLAELHTHPFNTIPYAPLTGMCCYCMCCRRAAGKKALKAKSFGEFLNTYVLFSFFFDRAFL
jgi:hypothetical protein